MSGSGHVSGGNRRLRGPELVELLGAVPGRLSSDQLYASTRHAILDGRLQPGVSLPAERELARATGTSRTLVARALELLRDAGLVDSRRGSCSWVTLPAGGAVVDPVREWINFAQAAPAAPPELAEAFERVQVRMVPRGGGYEHQGLLPLRERIAAMYTRRGLPTTPEQIVVTNGAQNAFAHVLRTLVSPGERVLVEHPTYPNALEAIKGVGASAVPVPMGADGWETGLIEAAFRQASPRLAYLIPDFHNPTGLCMGADQRERVCAGARASRAHLVVDETLVDLDLSGKAPPPPMASFAEDVVLTVGSASKSFWGGLRLGWIRASTELVPRLLRARTATDLGSPVLEQVVLTELLDNSDAVLSRVRAEAAARRDDVVAALNEHLPKWTFRVPMGGLSLWCDIGAPVGTRLAESAEQRGVLLAPGARFGVDGSFERCVRVPYTLPVEQASEAVRRLAIAMADVGTAPGPGALEAPVA